METNKIRTFQDLIAWREGHKLVLELYMQTELFPRHELLGLVSQIRRAGVSITSNIAEGFSRRGNKEKIKFYFISLGSISEIQNQLLISRDLSYLSSENYIKLIEQTITVQKLINGLIKSSKNRLVSNPT